MTANATVSTAMGSPELANGFSRVQIARCISSRRLELTLLPTEKCNFRCVYCYEDFVHGRMPPHVVAGVKNLIRNRARGLEELHLSWFGGEPLLAVPVIRDISAHAKRLAETNGFRLSGGTTTNGYLLTPALLTELVDLNQSFFQISLDGAQEQHDRTRIRADGAGTFNVIWGNLLAARSIDRDFLIQFRVHLTHDNFESLKELVPMLRDEFGSDPRFRLDLQHIRNMGGTGASNVKLLRPEEIEFRVKFLRALGSSGDSPSDVSGGDSTQPAKASEESSARRSRTERGGDAISGNDICYASKPNHWLVRSNGQLGRCTVILDDPKNDMGCIEKDGTLRLHHERISPWFVGFEELDPDLLACPAHKVPEVQSKHRKIAIKAV